ncbi:MULTISPECIES: ABC transporter ATP-binding protein [Facklamia]|uniref:ABC transporter domain-containing protein n=2 Tax=Facklamia hominis TaxID=178214 RepID=K1LYA3_9LACT|nr:MULTISPECIES: ABC transporter ATP-binding protein [Facklamia]EKB55028.1 hypothetical protein HMPREF9706_01218 [Facklamia hominis CCUG 36813]MDK7187714.1 ABC transporter ATP-binding protein [Facklamia hominis]OFL67537.1 ABC transporter ATP-binding protein [Facklamia sp. HMSC062C11]RYC98284.1 ABC transporter ATP-binding protein [Facklamia hominis]
MTRLIVKNLSKNFGGLAAVSDVSLTFDDNALIGLIGPNGAGKTTLFNLLTGVYVPSSGEVLLEKEDQTIKLNGMRSDQVTHQGLARTFQNIRLFPQQTVIENVLVAMDAHKKSRLWDHLLRTSVFYQDEAQLRQEALNLLERLDLADMANEKATNLAYGQQRRLEIARALATNAKILFLDEPAAGMNPQETDQLSQLILAIQKDFKMTIVLIEHDMSLVMGICEKIYVLEYGRLIAQGSPEQIRENPRVIKAYLGG